jgi:hypothetical protein
VSAEETAARERRVSLPAPTIVCVALASVCLILSPAPVARAGEWTQVSCTQPNGQPAPAEAASWQPSGGGFHANTGATNSCASHGALTAFDSATESETAYVGPMWTYTAPSGSTIVGGSLVVSLIAPHGQAYLATPENSFTNSADVLYNCQYNEACGSGGYTGTVGIPNLGGTHLFAKAMCVGVSPGENTCQVHGSGSTNAEVSVYAADIELFSESRPTGTSFSGALLEAGAKGTADLAFSAEDPNGPGVYRVTMTLDGAQVYGATPHSNSGRCASIGKDEKGVAEFLYPQPCEPKMTVDIPLDTTKFSDGSHTLKTEVEDVAGNKAVVLDRSVSFTNHPTSPVTTPTSPITSPITSFPGLPSGGSTGGSGTGGSGGAGGSVAISVGPTSAAVIRGALNGTNASDQATLSARWARTSGTALTSRYGVAERVTGRLTTSAGQPISGAAIDVYATPGYQGAKARLSAAGVRTGPTGTWTLTVPPGLSSSTFRFAYRSHVNDTVDAASATLRLNVHAGMTLRIAPRAASVGRTIYFSGVLHGTPIPPGGKQLVLEASSGRGWVQFDTIRTSPKGRYHASYRFRFPGPVTYRFRVLSRYEADFPFLNGTSSMVTIHEH